MGMERLDFLEILDREIVSPLLLTLLKELEEWLVLGTVHVMEIFEPRSAMW